MMSEPLKLAANLPLKLSGMLGMLTFKPLKVQFWKALMPIEVTELPMNSGPLYDPLTVLMKLAGMLGMLMLKPLKVHL